MGAIKMNSINIDYYLEGFLTDDEFEEIKRRIKRKGD